MPDELTRRIVAIVGVPSYLNWSACIYDYSIGSQPDTDVWRHRPGVNLQFPREWHLNTNRWAHMEERAQQNHHAMYTQSLRSMRSQARMLSVAQSTPVAQNKTSVTAVHSTSLTPEVETDESIVQTEPTGSRTLNETSIEDSRDLDKDEVDPFAPVSDSGSDIVHSSHVSTYAPELLKRLVETYAPNVPPRPVINPADTSDTSESESESEPDEPIENAPRLNPVRRRIQQRQAKVLKQFRRLSIRRY